MIIFLSIFIVFFSFSCAKDKAIQISKSENSNVSYCASVTVSFSSQIRPIFIQSCATSGCHNSASSSAGYKLENYTDISTNTTVLLKSIKHDGASAMPKFQPMLHDSLIQQFECWINQGNLNN